MTICSCIYGSEGSIAQRSVATASKHKRLLVVAIVLCIYVSLSSVGAAQTRRKPAAGEVIDFFAMIWSKERFIQEFMDLRENDPGIKKTLRRMTADEMEFRKRFWREIAEGHWYEANPSKSYKEFMDRREVNYERLVQIPLEGYFIEQSLTTDQSDTKAGRLRYDIKKHGLQVDFYKRGLDVLQKLKKLDVENRLAIEKEIENYKHLLESSRVKLDRAKRDLAGNEATKRVGGGGGFGF